MTKHTLTSTRSFTDEERPNLEHSEDWQSELHFCNHHPRPDSSRDRSQPMQTFYTRAVQPKQSLALDIAGLTEGKSVFYQRPDRQAFNHR